MHRMKWFVSVLIVLIYLLGCTTTQKSEVTYHTLFDVDEASQRPTKLNELFSAPDRAELNGTITPDGREFYFSVWEEDGSFTLKFSKFSEGAWSSPETAPFAGEYSNVDPCLSADGKRLYFISNRPDRDGNTDWDIYMVQREEAEWSQAFALRPPINLEGDEFYPSVSSDEVLYYTSKGDDSLGERDIYRVHLMADQHVVEHLPSPVNSPLDEGDVCVAPDGSYLIIKINGRDDSLGRGDLFISRQMESGNWSELKNLGPGINSEHHEYSPMLTPDGRFLLFTRVVNGESDIYSVSTDVIISD